MGQWSAVNAAPAKMDLTKLRELPVLDIRGLNDSVIPPRDGLECQPLMNSEVALISDSGHLPFAERPEDFFLVLFESFREHNILKS